MKATALKPSRELPNAGYCAHCGGEIFNGGPATLGEFPLTCECGYSTSLMDLGFYDSTDEDKDLAEEVEIAEGSTRLSEITGAIEAAESLGAKLVASIELNKAQAEAIVDAIIATAEDAAKGIVARAEAAAAELLTRATTAASQALESVEKDPPNDSENEGQTESATTPEPDSVSSEQS